MSANTKIEWCHATVNWWAGCTAISPACDNCYAKRMAGRLWETQWGPGKPRHQFIGAADALRALDRKAKRLGQPLLVFHNSLSDFFDNEVPQDWRDLAFQAMAETPNLIHLLLTKRIGNAGNMLPVPFDFDKHYPNVWIGITVVNQEEADRDIPKLLAIPAAKRFLSMEPLLGPVDLTNIEAKVGVGTDVFSCLQYDGDPDDDVEFGTKTIDWVIVGGESGPSARPMHPDWAFDLRDQCAAAGVQFMFKQWGEWTPGVNVERQRGIIPIASLWNDTWQVSSLNLATDGGHIDDEPDVYRVGKKEAGRMLDGREWNGFPS